MPEIVGHKAWITYTHADLLELVRQTMPEAKEVCKVTHKQDDHQLGEITLEVSLKDSTKSKAQAVLARKSAPAEHERPTLLGDDVELPAEPKPYPDDPEDRERLDYGGHGR